MTGASKTLFQCDFDGTITEEDASFVILDAFADGDWKKLHREYEEARISVGRFNTDAFAMVKASRQRLLAVIKAKVKIRPGLHELMAYCRRKGIRFVIVSNGLDFYIEEILRNAGISDIEVFAAETRFQPDGLAVKYIGPDGTHLDEGFKESHVNSFLAEGYRIIYAGNGTSDISPAKRCHYIFATGSLLEHCRQTKLDCAPFTDLNEIVKVLEVLDQ